MKTPLLLSSSLLAGLLIVVPAASASAQEPVAPPPPAAPPPAAAPPANNAPVTSLGDGAIGVGAEQFLSGLSGAEFVYDQPMFHIEGILGYNHTSAVNNGGSMSNFQFGVGGWYHLARGTNADFSVGGSVGLNYASTSPGGSSTGFVIEPGAEGRVFLSPNFALMGRVGFAITTGDNTVPTTFSIGGQTTTAFGFTYFFR